jgi:hypothetical protein
LKRLAYDRLAAVVMTAAIAATLSQWQGVFGTPLPDGAGVDEVLARAEVATVRSLNAIVSAAVGAVMGFLVRADKDGPWTVLKDKSE